MNINDKMEECTGDNDRISEAEDFFISDTEETSPCEVFPLSIDYNARVVTTEEKCDDEGDDCDTLFVQKPAYLGHRGSEAGFKTSTEDLNVSDEEGQCHTQSSLQPVDLDKITSTSKTDENSLSTLNYSHTVFKDESSIDKEYLSNDEISNTMTASPKTQGALNSYNNKNILINPLLLEESDMQDLNDEQESPPMTCLEFLKSEISDEHTDAEDLSVGSLDDIIELSKYKNPFGKSYNAFNVPVSLSELPSGNVNDDIQPYPEGSRRSSAAEFHTEDEIFSLENFCDRGKKRIKKRSFIIVDKNEKSTDDSLTDEEVIGDQ